MSVADSIENPRTISEFTRRQAAQRGSDFAQTGVHFFGLEVESQQILPWSIGHIT